MPDLQKVIRGLEVCIARIPGKYICYNCPYEVDGNDCELNLSADALALLRELKREQEQEEDDGK